MVPYMVLASVDGMPEDSLEDKSRKKLFNKGKNAIERPPKPNLKKPKRTYKQDEKSSTKETETPTEDLDFSIDFSDKKVLDTTDDKATPTVVTPVEATEMTPIVDTKPTTVPPTKEEIAPATPTTAKPVHSFPVKPKTNVPAPAALTVKKDTLPQTPQSTDGFTIIDSVLYIGGMSVEREVAISFYKIDPQNLKPDPIRRQATTAKSVEKTVTTHTATSAVPFYTEEKTGGNVSLPSVEEVWGTVEADDQSETAYKVIDGVTYLNDTPVAEEPAWKPYNPNKEKTVAPTMNATQKALNTVVTPATYAPLEIYDMVDHTPKPTTEPTPVVQKTVTYTPTYKPVTSVSTPTKVVDTPLSKQEKIVTALPVKEETKPAEKIAAVPVTEKVAPAVKKEIPKPIINVMATDEVKEESALSEATMAAKPEEVKAGSDVHKVLMADVYGEDIPADSHYDMNWNNQKIHAYKYDLTKMEETVEFFLTYGLGEDMSMPLDGYMHVTSNYGPRGWRHHNGIDLRLKKGDNVRTIFEGKIRIAQYSSSYGYVIVVRHFNGLETFYAHLSKMKVKEGDMVSAGQVIGLGGNTGHSTGNHLHLEVRYKGHPINPNEIIDFAAGKLKHNTFTVDKSYFTSSNPYQSAHGGGSGASSYHTIRRGDTLGKIAQRYRTSVKKLCSLNKISTRTTLRVGRKIRVR